jgi:hypothetical protein
VGSIEDWKKSFAVKEIKKEIEVKPTEVKPTEVKPTEVKPITTVKKDVEYEIFNQEGTESKQFKWTGKRYYGLYTFSDKDGKEIKLTLAELNDRLKKGEKI